MLTMATLGALLPHSQRVRRGAKRLYQRATRKRWHDQPRWWEGADIPQQKAPDDIFPPRPGFGAVAPAATAATTAPRRRRRRRAASPIGQVFGSYFGQPEGGLQAGIDATNRANRMRLNRIMGLLNRIGGAERGAIGRQERADLGQMRQTLINRGLGGSTVLGPMMSRVRESAGYRRQRLAEMLSQQRAGILERVEDVPPPVSRYLDTLERLNQARSY